MIRCIRGYPVLRMNILLIVIILCLFQTEALPLGEKNAQFFLLRPEQVKLNESIVSRAIESGETGRVLSLPEVRNGWYFKIYSKDSTSESSTCKQARQGRNWMGEHVGKWMISTARAANRTQNPELIALLKEKADFLIDQQYDNGYLATYIPSMRFYSDERKDFSRTWDVWSSAYNILGLLEINKYWPDTKYTNAAIGIGDLLYKTFYKTGKSVAYRGNHDGLSGVVVLEPIVELYNLTGKKKYLNFAEEIMSQIEERPELQLMKKTESGTDIQKIGDGKIYQLLWLYVGIAKLYKVTGNADYFKAVDHAWNSVVTYHLTPTGGAWGGIATDRETFNRTQFWSPYGIIETCNTMSWIHLNRELYLITGDTKYIDMLETVFYNALLGAQYFDGENWQYFSNVNGIKSFCKYWSCCRSSGMVSLEEYAPLIYAKNEYGISVNFFSPSEAEIPFETTNWLKVVQKTAYPQKGEIHVQLFPEKTAVFNVSVRIPAWAKAATFKINGEVYTGSTIPGNYVTLRRKWQKGDLIQVSIQLDIHFVTKHDVHYKSGFIIHENHWFAVSRGPIVYATHGRIYGKEREEVLDVAIDDPEHAVRETNTPKGFDGPAIELLVNNRDPLLLLPYYEAGGIEPGKWRFTWLQYQPKNR